MIEELTGLILRFDQLHGGLDFLVADNIWPFGGMPDLSSAATQLFDRHIQPIRSLVCSWCSISLKKGILSPDDHPVHAGVPHLIQRPSTRVQGLFLLELF